MPCFLENGMLPQVTYTEPAPPRIVAAREPLPRPTVEVTPATERDSSAPAGSHDVVISRENKVISSHRTKGGSTAEQLRDSAEKMINSPAIAEALP
jgi:hypothetical protein